jgi:hypothetical protein
MANEVISYIEMCQREGVSLQQGMNFGIGGNHSVILLSLRPGAPYHDEVYEQGTVLVYEGHDVPRSSAAPDPKMVDQHEYTPGGTLTQNGRFMRAASEAKDSKRLPERVRAYEKLRQGIWAYNGTFLLVDAWRQDSGTRKVFKFRLEAVEGEDDLSGPVHRDAPRRHVIPTPVKLEVWGRDGGRCVECGATDDLHFDHIIPYARGGSSLVASNVQLLCARHNLSKADRIE